MIISTKFTCEISAAIIECSEADSNVLDIVVTSVGRSVYSAVNKVSINSAMRVEFVPPIKGRGSHKERN
jgi:hypothetical protein